LKKFIHGFQTFAFRGNILDLAVGIMIGGAFGKIVSSMVGDLFMPLLSVVLGRVNLSGAFLALDGNYYVSAEDAAAAGVGVFRYGAFLQTVIDFFFMALVIYGMLQLISHFLPKRTPEVKPEPLLCPFCRGEINELARRCPHCTSSLEVVPEP